MPGTGIALSIHAVLTLFDLETKKHLHVMIEKEYLLTYEKKYMTLIETHAYAFMEMPQAFSLKKTWVFIVF